MSVWKKCSATHEVSEWGDVRHIRHKRILKWSYDTNGYPQVNIGGRSTCIHQLVAKCFLGIRPKGYIIHHRDLNKKNPQAINLEYRLLGEHRKAHRKDEKLIDYTPPVCDPYVHPHSESHKTPTGKYNSYLLGLIKNSGLTQNQFAKQVGIHYVTLSLIINNKIFIRDDFKNRIADWFGKPITKIFNRRKGD